MRATTEIRYPKRVERERLNLLPSREEEGRAIELFSLVGEYRQQMENALFDFLAYVNDHPRVRRAWERFVINGGADSADLRKCFATRAGSPHESTRRGLLRVVARVEAHRASGA
jgi:hypothetical protein